MNTNHLKGVVLFMVTLIISFIATFGKEAAKTQTIAVGVLKDKIAGGWAGKIVGEIGRAHV